MNNIFALSGIVVKELYRRKDFYVLFILTALVTVLLGSVNFFNDKTVVRFLKEACLLLIWISSLVIAVTTTARQIPAEKENRTIFPLLAKPVTRTHLILGKFLGCWIATGMSLLLFYLFFALVTGSRDHSWPLVNYFQALWLHWMFSAVVVALVLLGSIVFAAPSSNATISFIVVIGILLLGRHLNKVAVQLTEPLRSLLYSLYFAIPHLEFFDVRELVIHNAGLIPWDKFALATLYGTGYTAVFLIAACLVFQRKSLA